MAQSGTVTRIDAARAYLQARGLDRRVGERDWYLRDRVAQPYSVVLRQWAGQKAALSSRGKAHAGRRTSARNFVAGGNGVMTGGMTATDLSINQALFRNLKTMRARANELARNNDYAKQFLRMVKTHVVGPAGVGFQAHVKNARGDTVEVDSEKIEAAWRAFGQRQVCDFQGELSWLEFQTLWIVTIAREGEVLVRRIKGAGPHGYQLQLLSPGLLDETLVRELDNGHHVRMGIEFDANWRRVAYWLLQDLGNNPYSLGITADKYLRVPADEIWHDFLPEWIGQWRGIPWMVTGIATAHRLGEFENSGLMAAEEGAKKLTWIKTPTGDLQALANNPPVEPAEGDVVDVEDEADTTPVAGTIYTESGQGVHYAALPPDYEPVPFDSRYPDASAPDFIKHFVRRMAAGWGVPYHTLSGNLEGVNFTSSRTGELEVREVWKTLQQFLIDRLCERVHAEWLPLAIIAGVLALPYDRKQRYLDAATWQGRRWSWVDPTKDVAASVAEIEQGMTSLSRVIRESKARDPEEVFEEIRRERTKYADVFELLAAARAAAKPTASSPPPDSAPDPEADPAADPAADSAESEVEDPAND